MESPQAFRLLPNDPPGGTAPVLVIVDELLLVRGPDDLRPWPLPVSWWHVDVDGLHLGGDGWSMEFPQVRALDMTAPEVDAPGVADVACYDPTPQEGM